MTGLLMKELHVRAIFSAAWWCVRACWLSSGRTNSGTSSTCRSRSSMTEQLEAARSGNWFLDHDLVIARLDKLSRDDAVQAQLAQTDWDLIVCDEAHKLSATFFGGEVRYTKRYRLGHNRVGQDQVKRLAHALRQDSRALWRGAARLPG